MLETHKGNVMCCTSSHFCFQVAFICWPRRVIHVMQKLIHYWSLILVVQWLISILIHVTHQPELILLIFNSCYANTHINNLGSVQHISLKHTSWMWKHIGNTQTENIAICCVSGRKVIERMTLPHRLLLSLFNLHLEVVLDHKEPLPKWTFSWT